MTSQQIDAVRRSHARLAPITDQAAALFYRRLFTTAPALKPLFIGDIRQQGAKLMQMIGAAVHLLDQPESLLPVLARLGARHAGYGVQPSDYPAVGVALIGTLEQSLGAAFDAETREAWATMYALVSHTMITAGHPEVDRALA
jgi:hemoglobin-like flavoprotein